MWMPPSKMVPFLAMRISVEGKQGIPFIQGYTCNIRDRQGII